MTTLMQQEIFSEPKVIKRTIAACRPVAAKAAKYIKDSGIKQIVTMARGTSDNAATVFSFLAPLTTGIKVGKFHPSVYTVYDKKVDMSDTCMLIISQSGMSKDTVDVFNKAKAAGAMVIAVTNNMDSPVAKRADFHLFMDVDEEKSVAATKTYIGELVALMTLAEALGADISGNIDTITDGIAGILDKNGEIACVAKALSGEKTNIILSRGTMLGTGDECALKLTECCYMFNRSFSTANFMHGPFSLIDESANVIMLAPSGVFTEEYKSLAARIVSLGGKLTVFSDIPEVLSVAANKVVMHAADDIDAPVLYGVAVSLLALNVGLAKGLSVDTPRNLNKVTVTL
ncbi:MAG: SIS domain-containing protein [Clostridia bacterium]|nr:SIS domain-containing protein [Clostridia bacterium]